MTEIKFNGGFKLPSNIDPQKFINELSKFLSQRNITLFGSLQAINFDDVEIIEEICTNVEQTEAIDPVKTVEDIHQ